MADEPHSGEQQQADNTTPIVAIGPKIEQTAEPADAADGEGTERPPRKSLREAAIRAISADWKRSGIAKLKAQEVWPLFLGFVAVAVAAFTLRILAGQLTFMELQLSEMQSGGEDTNALARAAKRQADSTSKLADRMEDQASQTRKIADQSIVQANAAKSAAQTASDTLHTSERAYVDIGTPQLNIALKMVTVPILNNGRIPSGRMEIVVHESTNDMPDIFTHANFFEALERHWHCYAYQQIPPVSGPTFAIVVPIVKMNPDKLKTGLQTIFIAGFMSYNDGFDGTRQIRQPFCIQSFYSLKTTELGLSPCNPVELIPELELADGYPDKEQSDEPQRPN